MKIFRTWRAISFCLAAVSIGACQSPVGNPDGDLRLTAEAAPTAKVGSLLKLRAILTNTSSKPISILVPIKATVLIPFGLEASLNSQTCVVLPPPQQEGDDVVKARVLRPGERLTFEPILEGVELQCGDASPQALTATQGKLSLTVVLVESSQVAWSGILFAQPIQIEIQ